MAKVFLFNIEDPKGVRIKNLCRKLYIETEDIEKDRFGYPLGYLLGLSENASVKEGEDFDDEMLYLCDIDGEMLNIFLSLLRRQKTPVDLKAVKTDANLLYTPYELYRELSAEREALSNGMQAHQG